MTKILMKKRSKPLKKNPENFMESFPMTKWSIRQYRGWDDFVYGSFDVYVTETEIIIRGKLKRGNNSPYILLTKVE